jgi:hypothetical protein
MQRCSKYAQNEKKIKRSTNATISETPQGPQSEFPSERIKVESRSLHHHIKLSNSIKSIFPNGNKHKKNIYLQVSPKNPPPIPLSPSHPNPNPAAVQFFLPLLELRFPRLRRQRQRLRALLEALSQIRCSVPGPFGHRFGRHLLSDGLGGKGKTGPFQKSHGLS